MAEHEFNEKQLRALLAQQLEILEDGLLLTAEEFFVPAAFGCTKSFIDILAKDRYGAIVIIEVKRSDAAARQALHEVKKYSVAVRGHFGKGATRVRTMVVSTDWTELSRPFYEMVAETSESLEGYVLKFDGLTMSANRYVPLDPIESLALCPIGLSILSETAEDADDAMSEAAAALCENGISDFFLVRLDYCGSNARIMYPHAVGVIRRSLPAGERIPI